MQCINSVRIALFLVIAANLCAIGSAQSVLEKLERAVQEALKQPSASKKPPTSKKKEQPNELPAPANQAVPAKPSPTLELPGKVELPGKSVLESPVVPAPINGNAVAEASMTPQGYLGLEVEPVIGGGIGVRVVAVADRSPAWKAGFRNGDVILGIDGHAIADLDGMVDQLRKRFPGEAVKFLVTRGDQNIELTAVLQDTSIASRIQGPLNLGTQTNRSERGFDPTASAWLGVAVSDLSTAFRNQFGISAYRGAAVTDVVANSPAAAALIKPGDAIVDINGQAVDSAQDVLAFVAQSKPGQVAELLVFRGATPRQVRITLGVDPKVASSRTSGFSSPNPLQAQSGPTAPPANAIPQADLHREVRALREELRKSREQLNNIERRMDQLLDLIAQPGT